MKFDDLKSKILLYWSTMLLQKMSHQSQVTVHQEIPFNFDKRFKTFVKQVKVSESGLL